MKAGKPICMQDQMGPRQYDEAYAVDTPARRFFYQSVAHPGIPTWGEATTLVKNFCRVEAADNGGWA